MPLHPSLPGWQDDASALHFIWFSRLAASVALSVTICEVTLSAAARHANTPPKAPSSLKEALRLAGKGCKDGANCATRPRELHRTPMPRRTIATFASGRSRCQLPRLVPRATAVRTLADAARRRHNKRERLGEALTLKP